MGSDLTIDNNFDVSRTVGSGLQITLYDINEVVEVYINRGFKLHIRACYKVSEGICWIVQLNENA
jgi:hypothetical protein